MVALRAIILHVVIYSSSSEPSFEWRRATRRDARRVGSDGSGCVYVYVFSVTYRMSDGYPSVFNRRSVFVFLEYEY